MATMAKPRQSTIIKPSKTKEFFALMEKHTATADYWKTCSESAAGISRNAMDRIKKLLGMRKMSSFIYVELEESKVSPSVLKAFDCYHPDFNDFLANDALKFSADGMGVTYVLVDEEEFYNHNISVIFAFATLQAMSLYFHQNHSPDLFDLPFAEIKYFAIAGTLQKVLAYDMGGFKYYSTVFFEYLLMKLYEISTRVMGFQAIFLRANDNGRKLYKRKRFADASDYIIPYTDDDPLAKCTPMILSISDHLYDIFGI